VILLFVLRFLEMLSFPNLSKVTFFFEVKRFAVPRVSMLKSFVRTIFFTEERNLESLSYIFCSDDYLLTLNRQFLYHDDYTDIVTFNLAADNLPVIGECYISIDRIKENAHFYNTTINHELLRVIFHGALHLCGYADKTQHDISIIRNKEDHYLQLFLAT